MCTAASSPAWSTRRISASRARVAPRPGRAGTPWECSGMGPVLARGEDRHDHEAQRDDGVVAGHGDAEHPPGGLVALNDCALAVHEGGELAGADAGAAAGARGGPGPPLPLDPGVVRRDAHA